VRGRGQRPSGPPWRGPVVNAGDVTPILGLGVVTLAHLVGFVWWASRLTTRVDHIERWISQNEQTSTRLTELEVQLRSVGESLHRIEQRLDKMGGP